LAYEAKIDFLQVTNPFGGGNKDSKKQGASKPEQMKAMLRGAGK